MSRSLMTALRAPLAALLLAGSAATAATPAFADNDFVVLTSTPATEGDTAQVGVAVTASVHSSPSVNITMRLTASANHTPPEAGDAIAGTACGGNVDFLAVDTTILIPAHADPPQTTFFVPVCPDTVAEGTETFTVMVQNVQGAGAFCMELCATHGVIQDNDVVPSTMSVANTSATEGNSNLLLLQHHLNFTVTLTPAQPSSTVTVDYQTFTNKAISKSILITSAIGGSSCTTGTDYLSTLGTLRFNPGETQKTVQVTICGDTTNELDQTFELRLSNPTNATIADGVGVGTILDDD